MKYLIYVLLFVCSAAFSQSVYYVKPEGNDSNDGSDTTDANAWLTWTKAFNTATGGDSVYFMGGIYYSTADIGGERGFNSGTSWADKIVFINYPNEVPVLDCINKDTTGIAYNRGVAVINDDYLHFKGLTIRNVFQAYDIHATGIYIQGVSNLILEEMVVHNVGGTAYEYTNIDDSIYILNCDAYELCDTFQTSVWPTPATPGQNGVGHYVFNDYDTYPDTYDAQIHFKGCRVWNFSDNGWDGIGSSYTQWDSCWAFSGGRYDGEGCGWKLSATKDSDDPHLSIERRLRYCLGALNGHYAFSTIRSNAEFYAVNVIYENCSAYKNGYNDYLTTTHGLKGRGWFEGSILGSDPDTFRIVNSWTYKNEQRILSGNENLWPSYSITMLTNDWLGQQGANDYTSYKVITDSDFPGPLDSLSVVTAMARDRVNGNLPLFVNLNLAEGSDLIDAGTDVGLSYLGLAPDIGFNESEPPLPPPAVGYEVTSPDGTRLIMMDGKVIIGN